eukprot:gnl/MRDRNA2_/MRDRNA2_136916_c0_seq1.p1 gnl/MRDRNA2_/MRDRNA2_136916_c0~~gnl/MRDRNA2_/MRDRNA2_136916_c0_seq1.p1  ORF type:complete len:500 (+),score=107.06 gnl/MRDRNA2_/MRDRNA2_136916_c0_seq1:94-1593(+)
MEQFGSDDGSRFLSELASHTANLSACSEVEREYLRVRAKILDQQKCLEGWFQNMLVPRPGDELHQFNPNMSMMHPPQPNGPLRSQSNKYSKYSAASSGTQTPSTCSGSSELSRSSDSSQGAPGLRNWEPTEQERQFLLEQIQEVLFARGPQQPCMGGRMASAPGMNAPANFPDQQDVSGISMPQWADPERTSSANLASRAQNMQPQKVPIMGSGRPGGGFRPYMSQESCPPPFQFEQPMMAPGLIASLFPNDNHGHGDVPAIAPGSVEHMQMLSKIAELQQQLNEQQKLLEAATQGSGCPSIQAIPEQVQRKGASGYPRGPNGPMGNMHHPAEHLKPKGPHMAKDNKNHVNDKNGKAADPQLANSATLQTHLKALGNEDPSCIFIVRKVNRLGFRSVETLTKFFSQHDTVVKVLVAHSKVKRNQGSNSELYLRPGSLGFVLMKTPESVQKILAQGPTVTVQGTPIRVQSFSRLNSGVGGGLEMKGDEEEGIAGDDAITQ